jgi:hypothetical protein
METLLVVDSAGGGPGGGEVGGGAAVGAERMSIKRKSRNKLPMEENEHRDGDGGLPGHSLATIFA